MNIKITKTESLNCCSVCNDVREMKEHWDKEQELAVDDGRQEEATGFPGVPGYIVDDANGEYWGTTYICETCMKTIMRGVKIITEQDLLGISVKAE